MSRLIAAIALATFVAPLARGDEAYQPPPVEQASQVDVSVDIGAPGASVSFETFQQGLAPYGQWLNVGAYGPVWRPTVAAGWRPYYYGHWVWTDEGWLWVSDEPWGWGPYHYGRWVSDASYGWLWVPGYQWAPAWVSWRFSDDVVGWAPLAPGFSIYVSTYPAFYSAWTFVPCLSFVGTPVYSVAYAPSYQQTFFRRTMPAPPRATIYGRTAPAWGGPAHGFVEQRIGRTIPATPIAAVASPSQMRPGRAGGPVTVFRPPAPASGGHPGWGSPARPGWGPPGRVPAPGAQPGSRPPANRPGWGTPPSRGPAPVPPGSRSGTTAPPPQRPWGPPSGGRAEPGGGPRGGYAPAPAQRGGGNAPAAPAPRGGGYAPAQRGGGNAPAAPAPRGGGYAPAQRGGGYAPAAPAPRGGGGSPPSQGHRNERR
jgi:hypothetical protein